MIVLDSDVIDSWQYWFSQLDVPVDSVSRWCSRTGRSSRTEACHRNHLNQRHRMSIHFRPTSNLQGLIILGLLSFHKRCVTFLEVEMVENKKFREKKKGK